MNEYTQVLKVMFFFKSKRRAASKLFVKNEDALVGLVPKLLLAVSKFLFLVKTVVPDKNFNSQLI